MSFANYDLEAQKPVGAPLKANPASALDNIINNTSTEVKKFGLLIGQFSTTRKLIGTRRDDAKLRKALDTLQKEISELDSSIESLMIKVNGAMNTGGANGKLEVTDRQLMLKDRLNREFRNLHNNFILELKQYADKKVLYPLRNPEVQETTPLLEESDHRHQQLQQQVAVEEQINQTELQYQIALTQEREREIARVHEGVVEINSIMKDLGTLVGNQGEQVDTMENNMLQVGQDVHKASRELTKADEYQRKKGKWCAILLVALCVFVLIMVLAIVS
ncbi:CIC11C00000000407 [Sungouiella intermedia]|uniref:CIC11C00000000407 n=1 Tax=Sungouiella intermedia TaxID=45354 RepID=A0A1L0BIN7_9ASCO|nr:CIC11C00000000407 [[Candida] intermedia]